MATENKSLNPEWNVEVKDGFGEIKANDDLFITKAEEAGITKKELEKVSKFKKSFMHSAVEDSIAEAEKLFKENADVKEVEVTVPYGVDKSSKVKTHILREKEIKINAKFSKSGKDEILKKSSITTYVESHEYSYPKTKRKELEKSLYEAIAGA